MPSLAHIINHESCEGRPVFKDDIQKLELSRERDTDDFMLIRGSELLLHQFSHHYGHPLRDGTGFFTSDRTN